MAMAADDDQQRTSWQHAVNRFSSHLVYSHQARLDQFGSPEMLAFQLKLYGPCAYFVQRTRDCMRTYDLAGPDEPGVNLLARFNDSHNPMDVFLEPRFNRCMRDAKQSTACMEMREVHFDKVCRVQSDNWSKCVYDAKGDPEVCKDKFHDLMLCLDNVPFRLHHPMFRKKNVHKD